MRSLKILVTGILLSFVIATCEQTDIPTPFESTWDVVSLEQDPQLFELMGNFNQNSARGRASFNFSTTEIGELNMDLIMKTHVDEERPGAHYSIPIKNTDRRIKEWLVLEPTSDGYVGYIMHFESANEEPVNVRNLNGYIHFLDLNRELQALSYFEDGKQVPLKEDENAARTETTVAGLELPACCECEPILEYSHTTTSGGENGLGEMHFKIVGYHCDCGDPCTGGGETSGSGTGGDGGSGIGTPIDADGGHGGGGGSGGSGGTVGLGEEGCESGGLSGSGGDCTSTEELIAAQVMALLEDDPYLLLEINCSQITKWQALAQNEAPTEIKNKVNDLQTEYREFEDFAIQTLNDAGGSIVNMDYFSVNLTSMPLDPTNGQRFTPEGFLDYFRRNINDFVSGSDFEPYCEVPGICEQETQLWNSEDPTGAIVYIDIPADDGAVICSEYTSSSWYFMTLEAPGANQHPVSGTRQFGIEPKPDGSYDMFVRGVDRFDSNLIQNVNYMLSVFNDPGNPFFGADNLWESFQNGVNDFVNFNGGSSQKNIEIKNRTDWNKISEILTGERSIDELGCN